MDEREQALERALLGLVRLSDDGGCARILEGVLGEHFALQHLTRDAAASEAAACRLVIIAAGEAVQTELRQCLTSVISAAPEIPVVAAAAAGDPVELFSLIEQGAQDFLLPPFSAAEVLPRIWRLLEPPPRPSATEAELISDLALRDLVGRHPGFVAEVDKIPLMARSDATVLITGETGVGKELFARAIHYLSRRARHPFVPLNCGAIPQDLFENELFGHEAGAYTGAHRQQTGLLEEAEGGSLFLDEVDALGLAAQVKLLRVLQDREYRRLGSSRLRRADVRILAAMNDDPEESVRSGRLRRDLFYRLSVIPVSLPSLRDRREDIPALARHFLSKHGGLAAGTPQGFSSAALEVLMRYDWPGNVRELEHVVERAIVFCRQSLIDISDVLLGGSRKLPPAETFGEGKARVVAEYEKSYIENALRRCQGNIACAARTARKNRRAFFELMRKHHIDASLFRQQSA